MSFSDWKNRSNRFCSLMARLQIHGNREIEEVCQAAFKAGEREGRRRVEAIAENCVSLAVLMEREACAKLLEDSQATIFMDGFTSAAILRERSNVRVQGPAACGRSTGTKG